MILDLFYLYLVISVFLAIFCVQNLQISEQMDNVPEGYEKLFEIYPKYMVYLSVSLVAFFWPVTAIKVILFR